ncbi:MAG: serine/threonine protein kinase [Phycisphaerae bacterium]|nr:serine/threonine protein kinase [Phycisphaerae bacterium]
MTQADPRSAVPPPSHPGVSRPPASRAPTYGDDVTVPGCPNRGQLELFASKSRAEQDSDAPISHHLSMCPVCREVVRQLSADNNLIAEYVHANRGRFDPVSPLSASVFGDDPLSAGPFAGSGSPAEVVPGFRIEGEIHRGAQGVVYRAEQLSTRRRVALKTLLQGKFATSRQRQRFEREVEVVASLRHPNIVTLFESGRTRDGLMFFAMELVAGGPLSDVLRATEKPSREKLLSMFLAIVRAIAYAHQRGVIHRDLKPGNILIDEELVPHVLDFGLARTARGDETQEAIETTAAGEFLGTFAYAAPEQLKGDPDLIDVRTDVFALGVILYELLAGQRPWQLQGRVSIADLLIARLEQAPKPPSELQPGIDKDLDIITLTCLKSRPEERYQTAAALAEDIERFLRGEPILARRDSAWYVARKWVARHKVATTTATGFALVVVAGIIALVVAFGWADRERVRAETTLDELVTTLKLSNPETGIGEIGMSFIWFLDRLSEELDKRAERHQLALTDPERALDDYEIYVNLLNTIEAIQLDFGVDRLSTEARAHREERLLKALAVAKELATRSGERDHPEIAEATHNLARFHLLSKDTTRAEDLYRQALAIHERLHGVDSEEGALTMRHLAACLRQQARAAKDKPDVRKRLLDEGENLLLREQAIHARRDNGHNEDFAAALNGLAQIYEERGDTERAFALYSRALDLIRQLTGDRSYRTGRGNYKLGQIYLNRGQLDDALKHFEIAVDVVPKTRGEEALSAVEARGSYAAALLRRGGSIPEAALQAALAAEGAMHLVGGDADRTALVQRLAEALAAVPDAERTQATEALIAAIESGGAREIADALREAVAKPARPAASGATAASPSGARTGAPSVTGSPK